MQLPIAVVGSTTDHGGRIITGNDREISYGSAVARQGDLHECPLPGHGITPIIEGAPNNMSDGMPVAYVGCRTGCGARIVTGQANDTTWVDLPALPSGAIDHLVQTHQDGYDEHFELVDAASGSPAHDFHYAMKVGAQTHLGTTCAGGSTDHAYAGRPINVALEVLGQTRIGLKP